MSKNHKKDLNYFVHFALFISAVSGCVLTSAFASLAGIPVGITISWVGWRYVQSLQELRRMSQLSRKRGRNNKIVLFARVKLNTIEVLISKG